MISAEFFVNSGKKRLNLVYIQTRSRIYCEQSLAVTDPRSEFQISLTTLLQQQSEKYVKMF